MTRDPYMNGLFCQRVGFRYTDKLNPYPRYSEAHWEFRRGHDAGTAITKSERTVRHGTQ